jgi:O-antigen/teichoic acid export membrane protein
MAELRRLAWRGGFAMAIRQVLGMALSFAGLVALARLIGPKAYGTYVAALGVHTWLALVLQGGVDVFLVRKPEEPTAADAHQAFTLCLVLGGGAALLAWPAGLLAQAWIGIDGIGMAVTALLCTMPAQLATQVPLALMQRAMDYRRLAWAELAGHVGLYVVAVGAALAGAGLAAPLAGWAAQQVVTAALAFTFAGYRPLLTWDRQVLARMLRHGLGYSASVWIWHLRMLVNPLVVARLLGAEAAAGVAVTIRLAEALSFMRVVMWRVSLSALGRLQGHRPRLAAAVSEGMRLQIVAIAPLMVGFGVVAPFLVPFALGRDWAPVVGLFPFLALAYLMNGAFSLHSSALYALGRNREVAVFHALHVGMLFTAALLLVPRFGLIGYGMAEAAALSAYLALHTITLMLVGEVEAGVGMIWLAGFAAPLFAARLGPVAWTGPVLVLALPETRRVLAAWWAQLKELAHG